MRSDHIIGEAIRDFWDIPRHQSEHIVPSTILSVILNRSSTDEQIDLHVPSNPPKSCASGKITLYLLAAAATVASSTGPVPTSDLQSLHSVNQMTKTVKSLSAKDSAKLSPAWIRFIKFVDRVLSKAQKICEVLKCLSS